MHKVKTNLLPNILIAIAAVLLVAGIATSIDVWHINAVATQQAAKLVSAASHGKRPTTTVPATIKPTVSSVASYTVAANLPRYLIIPKLGVNAPVLSVGVNSLGALE